MADIADWRARIDAIDEQLVRLLNDRAACALAIGGLKDRTAMAVRQPDREADVLAHVRAVNRGPLTDSTIRIFFESIIDQARRLEVERRVPHASGGAPQPGASAPPFARVGIAGLGLIGGSVALAVRAAWPSATLVGFDARPAPRDRADDVVDERVRAVTGLAGCDLIVLAVPVPAMSELMGELSAVEATTVVTDVGSIKRQVMAAAAAAALPVFVGGHPMAGSERGGLREARGDLFEGRPWLLVHGDASPAVRDRLVTFVSGLGAYPIWLEAEVHDRVVAYVSHLPQVVAAALMNAAVAAVGEGALAAAGSAFVEMTRLASSPPDLWEGILAANADCLAEAIDRLTASLPAEADLARGTWTREGLARAGGSRARWRQRATDPAATGDAG